MDSHKLLFLTRCSLLLAVLVVVAILVVAVVVGGIMVGLGRAVGCDHCWTWPPRSVDGKTSSKTRLPGKTATSTTRNGDPRWCRSSSNDIMLFWEKKLIDHDRPHRSNLGRTLPKQKREPEIVPPDRIFIYPPVPLPYHSWWTVSQRTVHGLLPTTVGCCPLCKLILSVFQRFTALLAWSQSCCCQNNKFDPFVFKVPNQAIPVYQVVGFPTL